MGIWESGMTDQTTDAAPHKLVDGPLDWCVSVELSQLETGAEEKDFAGKCVGSKLSAPSVSASNKDNPSKAWLSWLSMPQLRVVAQARDEPPRPRQTRQPTVHAEPQIIRMPHIHSKPYQIPTTAFFNNLGIR